VYSLVGYGKTAVPLTEDEVGAIQALAQRSIDAEPWPSLCLGQPVRIVNGPLRGLNAILARIRDEKRVSVNISLLQRSVLLEIPFDHITPVLAA
jgi:transcription antitermination factor NusG